MFDQHCRYQPSPARILLQLCCWDSRGTKCVRMTAGFDRGCLNQAAKFYNVHLPALRWDCSLRRARRTYAFSCNKLGHLCAQLGIPEGTHHRAGNDAEMCARLYLRELEDLT
ncbi:MAG: hypothetical protein LIP09_14940 [Bacteroidales bacterium]|nr:hypothetical protein [Bacteroidales bacterium]